MMASPMNKLKPPLEVEKVHLKNIYRNLYDIMAEPLLILERIRDVN
jgi:hypothetical protein